MSLFSGWKERYQSLVERYGTAAIVVYFTLFFGTWFSFWLAIKSGISVEGAAADAGTVGGAYVATKLTQPLRIAATAAITPIAATIWQRLRRSSPEAR